jgi:hypothetical protein
MLLIGCVLILILLSGILYQRQSTAEAQAMPTVEAAQPVEPIIIADDFYGYRFEVPGSWYAEMGVTPDRRFFLSNPAAIYDESNESLHQEPPPEGFIAMQLDVAPIPDWVPEPETRDPLVDEHGNSTRDDLLPFLPSGTWTTVAGVPALSVEHDEQELKEGGGGHFSRATSIYIITERIVYLLVFAYAPPADGNESEYEEAIAGILDSFVIDLDAPVARQSLAQPLLSDQ